VNYPNPIRDKTEFTYMLTRDAEVTIRIYTISGKLIRKLEDIIGTAGFNRTAWNGRDEDEDELANGVYLYKITAETDDEKVEEVEKLIIMR
jgi:flagellar hook assembly protein FlgD